MSATEREFIFDAVVGFLTSPLWNTPVRSFIEQNSVVFDPDGENPEEHKEIHKRYKTMVEGLLTSFLKDVGISEQQFMDACKEGRDSSRFSGMNRDVFEQMWAAEDYEVFKRFMSQKNIELQLQALQIIQQIHNVQMPMPMPMPTPVAAPPSGAPTPGVPPTPDVDEEALLQEVLRRSKEEYESQQKDIKGKTKHELEKTLAESKEESERQSLPLENVVTEESTRLTEIAKREQEELEKALQISLEAHKEAEKSPDEVKQSAVKPADKPSLVESKQAAKTSPVESKQAAKTSPVESKQAAKTSPVESKRAPKPSPVKTKSPTQDTKPSEKPQNTGLPPLSGQPKKVANTPTDAAAEWIQSAKKDVASSSAKPEKKPEITPEELKRRAEYLKQQRDKLLALKKQEREKSLTKYTEQQPKARPTSSRAARRVTAGEQVDSSTSKSGEDDAKKLAMRRALADCLKREVIDKE